MDYYIVPQSFISFSSKLFPQNQSILSLFFKYSIWKTSHIKFLSPYHITTTQRTDLHLKTNQIITKTMIKILVKGTLPNSLCEVNTTPILKPDKTTTR